MAALIVGGLYSLGALFRAVELHGADLRVTDTLPLIPIEQLLARGITVVFDSVVAIATITLILALTAWLAPVLGELHSLRRERDAIRDRRDRGELPKADADKALAAIDAQAKPMLHRLRWLRDMPNPRVILVPTLLVGLFILPFPRALVAAAIIVIAGVVILRRRPVRIWTLTWLVIGLALAGSLAETYRNPPPLPAVALDLEDDTPLRGDLIVSTGSHWYVRTGPDRWRAVASDRVRSARIASSRFRTKSPSLWDWLKRLVN
jgi:hypothetical protein